MKYSDPFDHDVIDNFLPAEQALILSNQFPDINDSVWYNYHNPLEVKKTINSWALFPKETYKFFSYLNSLEFIAKLEKITGYSKLYPDQGLHGAGWHAHGTGGKLNVHLDYSIHPRLELQRKLNLIFYLTPNWDPKWGGNLEFWSHNPVTNRPFKKVKVINNVFNRVVLFNTTQNSWHGFADPISCPINVTRKSIAMYYLCDPPEDAEQRKRALYSPSESQLNNPEIEKLIGERCK